MHTDLDIHALLRASPLFAPLDEAQVGQVVQAMRVIALAEGERLFEAGQTAERFYLLGRGQVKLFRVSPAGGEKIVEILGPGKTFAEGVMFMERSSYPVSCAALAASEVLSFDSRSYLQLLRGSPALCLAMLGDLSMRLHARLTEIDHLTMQNAKFRVARYLDELFPPGDTAEAELVVPKLAIASRLAVTPETFSRILHTLAADGVIALAGRELRLLDRAALRRFGL